MRTCAIVFAFLMLLATTACKSTPAEGTGDGVDASTQASGTRLTLESGTPESFTVPVGEAILVSFDEHTSVGLEGEYSIGDPSIVNFVEKLIEYDDPESVAAGESGGDGASVTYVFRAEKPGTSQLTVQTMFRGEVRTSATYSITVVPR